MLGGLEIGIVTLFFPRVIICPVQCVACVYISTTRFVSIHSLSLSLASKQSCTNQTHHHITNHPIPIIAPSSRPTPKNSTWSKLPSTFQPPASHRHSIYQPHPAPKVPETENFLWNAKEWKGKRKIGSEKRGVV